MKTALFAFVLLFLNAAFAQHEHAFSNAKLAHDASHRLGKLVDTGRADESYINNLSALEVVALPHTDHTGPAYKVIASVGSGANQMELTFDMTGKYLSNKVIAQGPVEPSPWTVTGAAELIEAALHPVMEATSAELLPFKSELSKVTVKQSKKDDGSVAVVVDVTSNSTTKTLQTTLTPAGDVVSSIILQ